MRYIIHCSDPIEPSRPDSTFANEAEAARRVGFISLLIDHDALLTGDTKRAFRRLRPEYPGLAVYRGWMMHADAYIRLHEGLIDRGVVPLTDPKAYAVGHHLPEAYPYVGRWMPQMISIAGTEIDQPNMLASALTVFGSQAVTVKDWVKSQAAGYWSEACFIPDASATEAARHVVGRFRELQGNDLTGGLVFRRYIPLKTIGGQSVEWRCFCLNGAVIGCWPRFSGEAQNGPPTELLAAVALALPAPFFIADFALGQDGRWWLMETGDGQVSGFPDGAAEIVLQVLVQQLHRSSA